MPFVGVKPVKNAPNRSNGVVCEKLKTEGRFVLSESQVAELDSYAIGTRIDDIQKGMPEFKKNGKISCK